MPAAANASRLGLEDTCGMLLARIILTSLPQQIAHYPF